MPSSNDYDDADIAELMSWIEVGRSWVLERNEEAAAELSRLEGPGGFEYLVQEVQEGMDGSREEALAELGRAEISLERVLKDGRACVTWWTAEVEAMERTIATASKDGPPWGVWQQTFGNLPTPGLVPVHLAVIENRVMDPPFGFLHHHARNGRIYIGRSCRLSRSVLGPPKREELRVHHLRHLTEWTFGVAQRRGLFLDERRQLSFEALASHPGVREEALTNFLSKQRFVTAMEWNVVVDEAIAKARRAIETDARSLPDEDIVRSAAYGLTAELLEMNPAECERIEGEWRAELASWNPAD